MLPCSKARYSRMIFVSHPTGNANVRGVLKALQTSQADFCFYSTLAWSGEGRFLRSAPGFLKKPLARRTYPIAPERVFRRPLRELSRLALGRFFSSLTQHESGWASVDAVYRDLDLAVARQIRLESRRQEMKLAYSYEDCALETFRACREQGVRRVYDLPIAYWETAQRLLREEAERLPHWEPTLGGTRDSAAKLERKTEELSHAEAVICPSRFVYDSLPAEARETKKCVIAEFGSPLSRPLLKRQTCNSRLRVLFAGGMTQRKGLADVFAAMRLLKRDDLELVVMGSPAVPLKFYRTEYPGFTYEPPRPHHQVLELMESCDVFVLPSLVEGRALVQQEALSCGLPLIVTRNAGGEDLIEEGQTGFLVPIRSPEAIADKITWFADHRSELPPMSEAARRKAGEYTWERYGLKVLEAMTIVSDLALV